MRGHCAAISSTSTEILFKSKRSPGAALESLSVAFLTKQGTSTNCNAAELMRRAFTQLQLPVSIPRTLPAIRTGKRKGLWSDLPDALTRVLHQLVHPKRHVNIKLRTGVPIVWNIAQWYIELVVLRLSGYQHIYSIRIDCATAGAGEVERVPWRH